MLSLGGSWVCQSGFVDTKHVNVGVGDLCFVLLTLLCVLIIRSEYQCSLPAVPNPRVTPQAVSEGSHSG